ncbi:MAG TPA: hypothetical protein VNN79_12850 [Actinomycetota bacterium]|nr:hypothetical protein [Actinomycetota bacterium]
MNGELAQVVCLAGAGSAWLAGPGDAPTTEAQVSHWSFRYVGDIEFAHDDGPEASSVAGWLAGLRERGVSRLWLTTGDVGPVQHRRGPFAERYLVAFAGAGTWSLIATGRTNEVWRSSWEVADLHAPDQRIWHVAYRGATIDEPVEPPRPDIGASADRLRDAIGTIREFAAANGAEEWVGVFDTALGGGTGADRDLLPDAYPAAARELCATASGAWVFGGMGSWNDLSFQGPLREQYERVSEDLYLSALDAMVAATNADLTTG